MHAEVGRMNKKKSVYILAAVLVLSVIGSGAFVVAKEGNGALSNIWKLVIAKPATTTIVVLMKEEFAPGEIQELIINVDGYKTIHIASHADDKHFDIAYEIGGFELPAAQKFYPLGSTDTSEILSFEVQGPLLKVYVERDSGFGSDNLTIWIYAQTM